MSILVSDARVRLRTAELMAKGTSYTLISLIAPERDYTPDAVEHLIRYMWGTLESNHTKNEELMAIYCDIIQSVGILPPPEKDAIQLMMVGYEIRDGGIAQAMGVPQVEAREALRRAYRHISDYLTYRKLPE